MTNRLDMKVTISELATPTLYQVMVNIKEPRERAAMLKRVAEAYLCGGSITSLTPANILLHISSGNPRSLDRSEPASIERIPSTVDSHGGTAMEVTTTESPRLSDDGYKLDDIGDQFAGFA